VVPIGGGLSTFLLTLPSATVNFSDTLSLVQSGRQVLLRAQNGKPASFFVGDRFPITLSLLSEVWETTSLRRLPGSTIFPETSFNVGAHPSALVANNFTGGTLPIWLSSSTTSTRTPLSSCRIRQWKLRSNHSFTDHTGRKRNGTSRHRYRRLPQRQRKISTAQPPTWSS